MLSVLNFLLTLLIEIPSASLIVLLLCIQLILTGRSPLLTVHMREVMSPELIGSSPKSKGIICGNTECHPQKIELIFV